MSGLETAAAVYGLIVGTIAIIEASIEIYDAVKDKKGVPLKLRKVSDKLPSLLEILKNAEKQHELADEEWVEAGNDVKRCHDACRDLQDLLKKAYPKTDANDFARFCKSIDTVIKHKGQTAEQLLAEISECLDLLTKRHILKNTTLLEDMKATVDELLGGSGITMNNVHGDNIKTMNGDKKRYKSTGSSNMFNGSIRNLNLGGTSASRGDKKAKRNKNVEEADSEDESDDVAPNQSKEELWIEGLQDWLSFPEIEDRESEIREAHKETFRWALQPRQELGDEDISGPSLADWLRDGDGLFWIQGKLGSGKSTLMKYVWQSPLLQDYLGSWAAGKRLYRAGFFFTKKGASELQKSLQGLYRTLLAHLIRSDTGLAKIAFPHWRLRDAGQKPTDGVLRSALLRILEHQSSSGKCCFFIDGLDEYEEADSKLQTELAEDILSLSTIPGVKMVVASRPEASFKGRFDGCSTLHLHDLTKGDINAYVTSKVTSTKASRSLEDYQMRRIALEVIQGAKGVFLWVALVVTDLVIGIDDADSYEELLKKLRGVHQDLHNLFKQILLDRTKPAHRQQVARCLLIESQFRDSGFRKATVFAVGSNIDFDYVSTQHDVYDASNTRRLRKQLITHLPIRSHGLFSASEGRVTLVHSSLTEFLADPDIRSLLQEQAGNFNYALAETIGLMTQLVCEIDEIHEDSSGLIRRVTLLLGSIIQNMESERYRSGNASPQSMACFYDFLEHSWECYSLPKFGSLTFEQMIQHEPIDPQQRSETHSGLLEFACDSGFTYFVQHHIELNHGIPQTDGQPLLFYAVCKNGLEHRSYLHGELSSSDRRVRHNRLEPVELLLQNGADPNEIFQGSTPWISALNTVDSLASRFPSSQEVWDNRFECFLLALDAAGHMLRYGAQPDLTSDRFVGGENSMNSSRAHSSWRSDHISTRIFQDLLQKHCCSTKSIANCSCARAKAVRPKLVELAELVEQKKFEMLLGQRIHLGWPREPKFKLVSIPYYLLVGPTVLLTIALLSVLEWHSKRSRAENHGRRISAAGGDEVNHEDADDGVNKAGAEDAELDDFRRRYRLGQYW